MLLPRVVAAGYGSVNSPSMPGLTRALELMTEEERGRFFARFLDGPEWTDPSGPPALRIPCPHRPANHTNEKED